MGEKKKLTFAGINGNPVDATVRCQFCSSGMRQGSVYMGQEDSIFYWCDNCGAVASFHHNSSKKITGIELKLKYEENDKSNH